MTFDVGILVIRVLFGVAIAAHGAQKIFGWFGGYGLKGTGGIELPFLYAATATGVAFTGAGSYSLDALFRLRVLSEPLIIGGILVLAVVGAAVARVG